MIKITLLKKTFIKFLMEEDILTAFSNNLDTELDDLLRSFEVQNCHSLIIRKAFYWSKAPEGDKFWKNKSGEWANYLFDHKYIYKKIIRENQKKVSLIELSY